MANNSFVFGENKKRDLDRKREGAKLEAVYIYGGRCHTAHVSHKVLFEKLWGCFPSCVDKSRTALATIQVLFQLFCPEE